MRGVGVDFQSAGIQIQHIVVVVHIAAGQDAQRDPQNALRACGHGQTGGFVKLRFPHCKTRPFFCTVIVKGRTRIAKSQHAIIPGTRRRNLDKEQIQRNISGVFHLELDILGRAALLCTLIPGKLYGKVLVGVGHAEIPRKLQGLGAEALNQPGGLPFQQSRFEVRIRRVVREGGLLLILRYQTKIIDENGKIFG